MSDKVKGITVEIGGDTKGLDKAIKSVNGEIRGTTNELKQVERLLKLDPTNTELLAQKQTLLGKNIETVENKLQALKKAKDKADKEMADGTEVNQEQYRRLQREIVQTEQDLKGLSNTADDAGNKIEDVSDKSDGFTILKGTVADLAANGIQALINKTTELVEVSREYREDMNKLNTAFTTAGFSQEDANEVYSGFYKILGESDRAVEAVNHLAKLTDNQEDLVKWTNIAAGVCAEFTDSLPIEGLTEAANETAKVAKVTGPLADALNWIGISEDKFNEKLEKCNSERERAALITNTLSDAYSNSAEKYKAMNADIMANREATQKLTDAQAQLGAVLEPVLTSGKNLIADFATDLIPYADDAAEAVSNFGNYVLENKEAILSGLTAIGAALIAYKGTTTIQSTVTAFVSLKDAITKAKTAQQAFNAVAGSNALALTVTAIAALTTGLITYAATHKTKSEEILDSLKDLRESHEEAIKSIDKTASAERAEAESALLLKDKLYELEEQIKSGTLTQQEAEQAQEDFNTAAGEMEKIIPGITDSLFDETGEINIQKQAVNDLTQSYYDLAIAKSMVNAYQAKMDETAKALVDAKEKQKEAKIEYDKFTEDDFLPYYDVGGLLIPKPLGGNAKARAAEDAYFDATSDITALEAEYKGYFDSMSEYAKEVKKTVGDTTEEIEDDNDDRVTSTKTTSKKQSDILKKQFERDLKNLKSYHEIGLVSDEEYYTELAKLRNKYFKDGSDDWEKYTDEIYNFYTGMLKEAKDAAYKQLEDISNAQDAMTQKLQEGVKTFRQFSITEKGKETNFTKLADVGTDNRQLEQYNSLLDRLFEKRKDLPDNLMDTLSKMSVEDGISYVTAMLTATDEEFDNYLNQLERNEELAEKISGKVANNELAETAAEIQKQFSEVSNDFFEIGEESAKQYGEGFLKQLDEVYNDVRTELLKGLAGSALTNGIVANMAGNTTNTTNNSYNNSRNTNVTINTPNPVATPYQQRVTLENLFNNLAMQGVL